jgi:phosphoglycerate kinase
MAKLSVRDLDVRGKRVLVRVDFNVPIETRGGKIRVTDDTRIRETLPTINYLREHGAKTILMSHLGRPKGKPVEKYSLRPIGEYLHSLIHHPVIFSHDTIGDVPKKIVDHMESGDVALLENVRFQPGEESNDPNFAKALAELGDLYVNDAFGADEAVRRDTRGRKGVRQNRRFESLDGKGRHNPYRRRHGEHVPKGAGNSGRRKPGRSGQGRSCARTPRTGEGTRREFFASD